MKDLTGRFVGFLRVNWLRLLTALFLVALITVSVFQYQTNGVLARSLAKVATSNELLSQELGAQHVVIAQLNEEKVELEDQVAYMEQVLRQMVSITDVLWCSNMPTDALPEGLGPVILFTMEFVAQLPTEVQPTQWCADISGIFTSPQTGEVYIPISREFPGGAADKFIVYLEPVPGQPGYLRIAGFYDIIARQFTEIIREEAEPSGE